MGPAPPPRIACFPALVPSESDHSYEYAEVLQNSVDHRREQLTRAASINGLPIVPHWLFILQTNNLDPVLTSPTVLKMDSFISHYSVITVLFFSTHH